MFESVDDDAADDDGRRRRRRTPGHGYNISSPCEPEGSGELKISIPVYFGSSGFHRIDNKVINFTNKSGR